MLTEKSEGHPSFLVFTFTTWCKCENFFNFTNDVQITKFINKKFPMRAGKHHLYMDTVSNTTHSLGIDSPLKNSCKTQVYAERFPPSVAIVCGSGNGSLRVFLTSDNFNWRTFPLFQTFCSGVLNSRIQCGSGVQI